MANVLIIEPNRALGAIYKEILRSKGHMVLLAQHAQDAVEAADQARPDVVILELQLTGHDGIEFLQEFRSYPEWQGIPVIVISDLSPVTLAEIEPILRRDFDVRACLYKTRLQLDRLVKEVNKVLA